MVQIDVAIYSEHEKYSDATFDPKHDIHLIPSFLSF
jgi:hypothetical protein